MEGARLRQSNQKRLSFAGIIWVSTNLDEETQSNADGKHDTLVLRSQASA